MKRRIAGEERQKQIVAVGRDCLMSCDLVDKCSASQLVEELGVTIREAQSLKVVDSDWEQSVHSLFYRIYSRFGSHPKVLQALSTIETLSSSHADLKSISPSDQNSIPLAIRVWLEEEGVLKKDAGHAEQQSLDACPSVIVQNETLVSVAARALSPVSCSDQMDEETAVSVLEEANKKLFDSSVKRSTPSVSPEIPGLAMTEEIGTEGCLDSLEWIQGQRGGVLCNRRMEVWNSGLSFERRLCHFSYG